MSEPSPTTIALRCAHSLLLETPVTVEKYSRVWVSSMRPMPHHPDGWNREVWPAVAAGWIIPASCVFGTVVEFGADITTGPRKHRRPVRWYAVALAHEPDWLVVHGPHQHPNDAYQQATAWLTTARAYTVSVHAPTDTAQRPTNRPRFDRR
jgi:hypothetical protein